MAAAKERKMKSSRRKTNPGKNDTADRFRFFGNEKILNKEREEKEEENGFKHPSVYIRTLYKFIHAYKVVYNKVSVKIFPKPV